MPRNDPNSYSFTCACGGTMNPTYYGWRCDKCKHREVEYTRQTVTERDSPPEFPWTDCDCKRCAAKR